MARQVMLFNEKGEVIFRPTGFNVWPALFGVIPVFFRKDWAIGFIALLSAVAVEYFSGQGWIITALLASMYNRLHIAYKVANGYQVESIDEQTATERGLRDLSVGKFYGNELRNFILISIPLAILFNADVLLKV